MNGGGGLVLIVIALLVIYIGVTGKYPCFAGAFRCVFQGAAPGGSSQTSGPGAGPSSFIPAIMTGSPGQAPTDSGNNVTTFLDTFGGGYTPPFA